MATEPLPNRQASWYVQRVLDGSGQGEPGHTGFRGDDVVYSFKLGTWQERVVLSDVC